TASCNRRQLHSFPTRRSSDLPGTGNPGHEFANSVVVEQVDEFGDEDAFFPGPLAHSQLVAKIANGSEAHAGDAEMLAKGGDILRSEEHTSELQSRGHLVCRLL